MAFALFALVLALGPAAFAGRAFAAHGGVYAATSLVRLWAAEGQRPDRCDAPGAAVVLPGAALILRPR